MQAFDNPLFITNLVGSICSVPADYTKREGVLQLASADGAECLLQAIDTSDAQAWLAAFRAAGAKSDAGGLADTAVGIGMFSSAALGQPQSAPPQPPQQQLPAPAQNGLAAIVEAEPEKKSKSLFGFGKRK